MRNSESTPRRLLVSLKTCLWAVLVLCVGTAIGSRTLDPLDLPQGQSQILSDSAEDGRFYLRARWMDPMTGRFVSEDPFKGDPNGPVSLHRYLYANQSPVKMKDPTGKFGLAEIAVINSVSDALSITSEPLWGLLKNDESIKAAEKALPVARAMVANAIGALKNIDDEGASGNYRAYVDFFGDKDLNGVNDVRSGYELIDAVIRRPIKFKYLKNSQGVFGQTSFYGAGTVVYIGEAFLKPDCKDDGIDSRGGTIVHEISHQAIGTIDYNMYGVENAKFIAGMSFSWAVTHADNWEYFAESVR